MRHLGLRYTFASAILAFVVDAPMLASPTDKWIGPIECEESQLRELIGQQDGPQEIYALLSEGGWGGMGHRILLVFDDHALLRCDDGNGRTREREISKDELNNLRNWLSAKNVDKLPKFDEGAADGVQYEYVHAIHGRSERRVFMNNPPDAPIGAAAFFPNNKPAPKRALYGELTRRMMKLDKAPMRVSYESLKDLTSFRVVHPKENGEVSALAYRDNKLVAGILSKGDNGRIWYAVNETGLSAKPVSSETTSRVRQVASGYLEDVAITDGPRAGKHLLTSWSSGKEGLWISGRNSELDLLARGIFGRRLVITPDGNWVVVAKTQDNQMWNVPNGIVRIHLPSKRVFLVDLPSADEFEPLEWVEAHKKVLLYQQRDRTNGKAGPVEREFHLLDVDTGLHERVTGEFRPLFYARRGPLQRSTHPHQLWGAIPNWEGEHVGTQIGKLDTQSFQFQQVIQFPKVTFDSSQIWVDEAAHRIWVMVNGDILSVSMPN